MKRKMNKGKSFHNRSLFPDYESHFRFGFSIQIGQFPGCMQLIILFISGVTLFPVVGINVVLNPLTSGS